MISILTKYLYNKKFEKAVIFVFCIFLITNIFNIVKIINFNQSDEDLDQNPFLEKIIDTKFTISPNVYLIVSDMFASSEYMSLIYKNYNDQINNYLIKENFTIKKITCLIILIPRYLYQVFLMEVIYLMIIFLKKKNLNLMTTQY